MLPPYALANPKNCGNAPRSQFLDSILRHAHLMPLCLILAAGHVSAKPLEPLKAAALLKPVQPFDSDSLKASGEGSWRWLSIPESRLVLNPFTKVVRGVAPTRKGLSLHAGYFIGTGAVRLNNLLSISLESKSIDQAWWPYKLELSAVDQQSGMKIQATDFLADEHTIIRIMEFDSSSKNPSAPIPTIGGEIQGDASLPMPDVLVADRGEWFSATCLAAVGATTERASSLLPFGKLEKSRWAAEIRASNPGSEVVVASIAFSLKSEGADIAVQRAKKALMDRPASELLAERKQAWDRLIGKVPQPRNFGIGYSSKVTPELHRQWYYGAWTFLLSQVLSPLPENNYPYFSIAEGKASLWVEGDPAAPAQCSWTCFMCCGLLAGIMPDKAWNIYEGIMSRVTDEGILLGECLPSRKAQGAWLVYSATGERERLLRVYPAIKRYLVWREKNPRWIWGAGAGRHDIPDEKDSSFVVSHLIDVDYAIRIASVLGLEQDIQFWREMTARELVNYRQWFFQNGSDPMNFYFTESGKHVFKDRNKQEPCYILSGLAFQGMPADLTKQLQQYYLKKRKPDQELLGFDLMKYGETSYIAYGLTDRGMHSEAKQFIERLLMDTIRTGGDFGETLEITNGIMGVGGVCPTLFLAIQTIDFTLMQNGVRIDQGASNSNTAIWKPAGQSLKDGTSSAATAGRMVPSFLKNE